MADRRLPRFWWEYRGQRETIPEQYVYRLNQGDGADIRVEAFTDYLFRKFDISIIDSRILWGMEDRPPRINRSAKDWKDQRGASPTYFVAAVTLRDPKGRVVSDVGEAGEENITNYTRAYPASQAHKRALVNAGKQMFGLTNLRMAIDARDYDVPQAQAYGKFQGMMLEDVAQSQEGRQEIMLWASDRFTSDNVLQFKAREYLAIVKQGAVGQQAGPSSATPPPAAAPTTAPTAGASAQPAGPAAPVPAASPASTQQSGPIPRSTPPVDHANPLPEGQGTGVPNLEGFNDGPAKEADVSALRTLCAERNLVGARMEQFAKRVLGKEFTFAGHQLTAGEVSRLRTAIERMAS